VDVLLAYRKIAIVFFAPENRVTGEKSYDDREKREASYVMNQYSIFVLVAEE